MKQFCGKYLLFLVFLVFLSGCAPDHSLRNPEDSQMSLVVTYIDTSEASLKLTSADAKRLSPKPVAWYTFGVNPDGILYNDLLVPGIYLFEDLSGVSNKMGMTRQLPSRGPGSLSVIVKQPGIYFLGSYKLKRIVPKDFSYTRYELKRVAKPSEKEVLVRMQKYATSPVWKERLNRRIQKLP